jgi:hypothetical protein
MRLRLLPPAVVLSLVSALALVAPSSSAAAGPVPDPATAFAVGGPAFQRAVAIAQAVWGATPCAGDVTYSWRPLPALRNAHSTWSNPVASYGNAPANRDCHVVFNSAEQFDWPKFCTVATHEIGHLVGHDHDPAPDRLMSAIYTAPIAACAPDPEHPVPGAQTAAPASAVFRASRRSGRRVRRRCVVVRREGRKVRRCSRVRAAKRTKRRR